MKAKAQSVGCVQWNLLAREVASRVSEFGHAAKFRLREYRSVMADKVGSDYASRADSDTALEHSFQAYLDVAASFHCEVIDLLHHRLGSTGIDRVEMSRSENGLSHLGDLVLLPVRPVVGCENEFEMMFFTVRYQPVFEEELAGGPRSCDEGDVAAAKVN